MSPSGHPLTAVFVPPLQKKEARPVAALAFIWLLFLLPIGSCGTIGSMRLAQATSTVASVDSPAALAGVPLGRYASASLDLTEVARDEFPLGNQTVLVAKDHAAYSVAGARDLMVIADREPLGTEPAARAHRGVVVVSGQMCDADSTLVCQLPDQLDTYARSVQRARKSPMRVLLAGAKPHDMLWESFTGLGIAALVFLLGLAAMWLILRTVGKPGILAFERQVTLPAGPEAVRAKLRAQANPRCRIAHDSADLVVLLVGKTMAETRLMGARAPADIPLRVDVVLGDAAAYRGGMAHVRVFALFGTPGSTVVPAGAQAAVQAAVAWIVGVCEAP